MWVDTAAKEVVLIHVNAEGMALSGGTDESGKYVDAYRVPIKLFCGSKVREHYDGLAKEEQGDIN